MTEPLLSSRPLTPSRGTSLRWVLASLSLCVLLSALGTSIANVALPTLALAFNASFQEIQWVVLAYLLASTTLMVGVGRWGDVMGRRQLLLAGILVFSVASVLCGVAPTLGLLITARAAQGFGAAIMMVLSLALVGEVVPPARTGSAMGLLGTMSAIGTALGPSLGGVLMEGLGWRVIFFVSVPLGLSTLLLAYFHLPRARSVSPTEVSLGAPARFDALGTLLLSLTLAAYALGTTLGPRGSFGPLHLALLLSAGAGLAAFVFVETRAASPLVRLSMFRNAELSASLVMNALVSTVMMATLVVGPFYLSRGLGLGGASVGLVLSLGPLVVALTGVPAGRVADRFGARSTMPLGLLGMAAGCCMLSLLSADLGVAGYIAPIALVTASYALFQTANNTAVLAGVAAERRGVLSGLLQLSRNLGLITGASVMGAVFDFASATIDVGASPAEAVATGTRGTFAVATVLMVGALAVSLADRVLGARRWFSRAGQGAL